MPNAARAKRFIDTAALCIRAILDCANSRCFSCSGARLTMATSPAPFPEKSEVHGQLAKIPTNDDLESTLVNSKPNATTSDRFANFPFDFARKTVRQNRHSLTFPARRGRLAGRDREGFLARENPRPHLAERPVRTLRRHCEICSLDCRGGQLFPQRQATYRILPPQPRSSEVALRLPGANTTCESSFPDRSPRPKKPSCTRSVQHWRRLPEGLRHGFGIPAVAAGVPLPRIAAAPDHANQGLKASRNSEKSVLREIPNDPSLEFMPSATLPTSAVPSKPQIRLSGAP